VVIRGIVQEYVEHYTRGMDGKRGKEHRSLMELSTEKVIGAFAVPESMIGVVRGGGNDDQ
jgi:hypothetical protein